MPIAQPTTMRVAPAVAAALASATIDGASISLTRVLDRKLYSKVNDVLTLAGGVWNRKAKAHIFPGPAIDAMRTLLDSGTVEVPADHEFFATPQALAALLVDMAGVKRGQLVLEPSAGEGAIVKALVDVGALVDCYEIDSARLSMCAHAGAKVGSGGDFLAAFPVACYDAVVMNPPFSKGQDVEHVRHAFKFLAPGGCLVSVMGGGIAFRTDRRTSDFLDFLFGMVGTIVELPEDSFKQSGTCVRTVAVTMRKSREVVS